LIDIDSNEIFEKLEKSDRDNIYEKLSRGQINESKKAMERLRILSESQSKNIFKPCLPNNTNKIINNFKSPLSKDKTNNRIKSNNKISYNKDNDKDNKIKINNVKIKDKEKKKKLTQSPLSKSEYFNLPADIRLVYHKISKDNPTEEISNENNKINLSNKKNQNEIINRLVYEYETTANKIRSLGDEIYSKDSSTGQQLFIPIIPAVPKNAYGGTVIEQETRNVSNK
jgi:hypothetical protein